jgi:serine/threonine protein kinase
VVCDFGSAHFSDRGENTAPWENLCSYRYAAPEQEQRQHCDRSSDIFALGLMLNEMFTQRIPHGTGYRLIGSIAPHWAHLDALVERMIRQEPRDRPQSIAVVREALAKAVGRSSEANFAGNREMPTL